MKKNNTNLMQILKPTIVLGMICFITALLLALVNSITLEPIKAQELAQENEAKQLVMPQGVDFIEKEYLGDKHFYYNEAYDQDGKLVGYIFKNRAHGYGGPITVNVGVDPDGIIIGVKAMDLTETPGIGTQVEDPAFTDQFIGKTLGLRAVSGTNPGDNEIQAISGATTSSNAFIESVQMSLGQFSLISGGKNE
ncbi:MAG: RnfABCDGE type electron transport complex subunit G [Clostridiaceae bacterium]|nr:RnfABCDGE type electron transport complex subunit G [Clostridiaceae bacterium]